LSLRNLLHPGEVVLYAQLYSVLYVRRVPRTQSMCKHRTSNHNQALQLPRHKVQYHTRRDIVKLQAVFRVSAAVLCLSVSIESVAKHHSTERQDKAKHTNRSSAAVLRSPKCSKSGTEYRLRIPAFSYVLHHMYAKNRFLWTSHGVLSVAWVCDVQCTVWQGTKEVRIHH
jgi:hypothetical protein